MPDEQMPDEVVTVERLIRRIRDQDVILDMDLADLYQVETRVLVQAVKRNLERFPADFMFQLTNEEFQTLTSQIVMSNGRGGLRRPPYAFTEQGVAMISGVLRSDRAVEVNIEIMRAFVRMRRMIASHSALARKVLELEKRYDGQFKVVFQALRKLIGDQVKERRPVGFRIDEGE